MRLAKQRASLSVHKFFSVGVMNEGNLLPKEIVDATSVNKFEKCLHKFWQRYGH